MDSGPNGSRVSRGRRRLAWVVGVLGGFALITAVASAQAVGGGGCEPSLAPGSLADILDGDRPPCSTPVPDVTPAQSAASFANGHGEVVAASQPVPGASSIEPGLQEQGQSFGVTGSLITGEVAKAATEDGLALGQWMRSQSCP